MLFLAAILIYIILICLFNIDMTFRMTLVTILLSARLRERYRRRYFRRCLIMAMSFLLETGKLCLTATLTLWSRLVWKNFILTLSRFCSLEKLFAFAESFFVAILFFIFMIIIVPVVRRAYGRGTVLEQSRVQRWINLPCWQLKQFYAVSKNSCTSLYTKIFLATRNHFICSRYLNLSVSKMK